MEEHRILDYNSNQGKVKYTADESIEALIQTIKRFEEEYTDSNF